MMSGEAPDNFSWVIEGLLAGSSFPDRQEHFCFYHQQGIKHLVSLTEAKPPLQLAPSSIQHTWIPMRDFTPPTMDQIKQFTSLVDQAAQLNQAVVVHCQRGRGRTGTMLAAYMCHAQSLDSQESIAHIRRLRPHSIETTQQEDVIGEYSNWLKRNHGPTRPC